MSFLTIFSYLMTKPHQQSWYYTSKFKVSDWQLQICFSVFQFMPTCHEKGVADLCQLAILDNSTYIRMFKFSTDFPHCGVYNLYKWIPPVKSTVASHQAQLWQEKLPVSISQELQVVPVNCLVYCCQLSLSLLFLCSDMSDFLQPTNKPPSHYHSLYIILKFILVHRVNHLTNF